MYHWWDTGHISQTLKKDPKTSSMKIDDATARWPEGLCKIKSSLHGKGATTSPDPVQIA
jgi:hypothetical protein